MKQSLLFILVLTPLFFSCKDEFTLSRDIGDNTSIKDLTGSWVLSSMEDYTDNLQTFKAGNGCKITINFHKNNTPFPFTGKLISREVYGFYSRDDQRKVSNFSIFSNEQESINAQCIDCYFQFKEAFINSSEFQINESQLRFFYNNNTKSLTFDKVEENE